MQSKREQGGKKQSCEKQIPLIWSCLWGKHEISCEWMKCKFLSVMHSFWPYEPRPRKHSCEKQIYVIWCCLMRKAWNFLWMNEIDSCQWCIHSCLMNQAWKNIPVKIDRLTVINACLMCKGLNIPVNYELIKWKFLSV